MATTQTITFRQKTKHHQRTCNCAAYKFPHRAGSGSCTDPGQAPSGCGECGNYSTLRDPYGTGDSWYSLSECMANECPWGMRG